MTAKKMDDNINITEKATISLSVKGWWALVVTLVGIGMTITTIQLTTKQEIERLYIQNQAQHEQILIKIENQQAQVLAKLSELDMKQKMFVWKQQLENSLIFMANRRDLMETKSRMTPEEELRLRVQLRDFMENGSVLK